MIANTSLADPVGLELWRVRGEAAEPQPPYVENRALSALLYGVGMCEDYAAAFTMLLRAMGLEAHYVPGLT
jgi:transglutaminase-like putative cysteine protease